ncbi:HD domain-containing protein [Clostridium neuense]|uniref:HD domain-containing protein n=1 Tax=Clostridium neuense TaxID=1728934 RepID=A0ABW8TFR2_9CLOT
MNTNDRINLILRNDKFNKYLNKNESLEKHREFCHHNINHFLDVARIAYIISLEEKLNLKKDIIYAAALLHDIGKWQQYESNIPHNEASAKLAVEILKVSNFNDSEINLVTNAIKNHRKKTEASTLSSILYKSDKLSRNCFNCKAIKKCNWSDDKKNFIITY